MKRQLNRRQALQLAGTAAAGATCTASLGSAQAAPAKQKASPLSFCLNTSTIRSQKLSLVETMELVADAGYQGMEPWVREVRQYAQNGGSLRDVRNRAGDLGLEIVSMIGFAQWAVDDDTRRGKGVEDFKRDMELAASIGCKRIAAPPAGATRQPVELPAVAERYRHLLELGAEIGVVPQLELWGSSRTLSLIPYAPGRA